MNRYWVVFGIAVVAFLASGMVAYSHHAAAAVYDIADEAEIEGELVQIALRNPHSWIWVDVADADGETTRWGVEWGGARQLLAQGADSFRVGDEVVVLGNPGRNPRDRRMLMLQIVRPADGYSWGTGEGEQIQGAR